LAGLVIDQHMPGMTGLDVVGVLRRDGVVVPVVLITAKSDTDIVERARHLGILAVLEKPFSAARLVALLRA
jgi:FixJ family two-component response regulator